MEIDEKAIKGEGFKPYYITKIEELQLTVADKAQNLRRLQAQRNELNAKGIFLFIISLLCQKYIFNISFTSTIHFLNNFIILLFQFCAIS